MNTVHGSDHLVDRHLTVNAVVTAVANGDAGLARSILADLASQGPDECVETMYLLALHVALAHVRACDPWIAEDERTPERFRERIAADIVRFAHSEQ